VTWRVALAADDASSQPTTSPVRSWQPPKRLYQQAGKHRVTAAAPPRTAHPTARGPLAEGGSARPLFQSDHRHLACSLDPCWEQRPLCLYLLDWLSEILSVLYLPPPAARPPWPSGPNGRPGCSPPRPPSSPPKPAAATHARDGDQAVSRLLNHPSDDHTSTGGAP
jgi:hypothetical protein